MQWHCAGCGLAHSARTRPPRTSQGRRQTHLLQDLHRQLRRNRAARDEFVQRIRQSHANSVKRRPGQGWWGCGQEAMKDTYDEPR
jgi:hypothetical protein